FLLALCPNERRGAGLSRQREQRRRMMSFGPRCGIGKKNNRRFEAFGTVCRHHAHLVACHFHVPFDFGFGCPHPIDEALQRSRFAAFVLECKVEEFIERIGSFMAEPCEKSLTAALGTEELSVKRKRRRIAGTG